MIELVLTVVLLITISGLCSLFEAALYSVPASHLETLDAAGSRPARALKRLREDVDEPITAILSLNTIANTAGAAIAGALAARVLGAQWVVAFSLGLTLAILFFSEVLPKTVGVVHCRPLVPFITRPLQVLMIVFKPIVWLSGILTDAIVGQRDQEDISAAELVIMAHLGVKAGNIHADELEVIKNILALRDRVVRDTMTPRTVLFSVDASATIDEVAKLDRVYQHSRIPVYMESAEEMVGVLYRRDVLSAITEGRGGHGVKTLMKPVHFVLDSTPLDRLLQTFLNRRQHLFVVMDELGALAGVVTLEDVLEEILGREIVDEFDEAVDMRELARKRRQELLGSKEAGASGPVE